jgi:prevent-host-death family protein
MDEAPKIVPVTDVRRDAARLIEEVNRSTRPVFISQRGYLTAVLLSCDRYESLRREASANERARSGGRRPRQEPFLRTQYGPSDYETARLLAPEGDRELVDVPLEWLGDDAAWLRDQ